MLLLGAAAAASLQSICITCNEHMARHVPILLQLLHQVDTFAITNNAVIGLLSGVASIVQCMPHGEIPAALRELCSLQLTPLCDVIDMDVVPIRGTKTDPVLWLDRLAAIFRGVSVRLREGELQIILVFVCLHIKYEAVYQKEKSGDMIFPEI